jgi:hypothetical protein
MRWFVAAALLTLCSSPVAALDCPAGAYPWLGKRGVEYCRRDLYGPPDPTAGVSKGCPVGTRLSTDRWGARSCKPLNSRRQTSAPFI